MEGPSGAVYNRYLLDLDGNTGLCPFVVFNFQTTWQDPADKPRTKQG